jgi:hypothetical protein
MEKNVQQANPVAFFAFSFWDISFFLFGPHAVRVYIFFVPFV